MCHGIPVFGISSPLAVSNRILYKKPISRSIHFFSQSLRFGTGMGIEALSFNFYLDVHWIDTSNSNQRLCTLIWYILQFSTEKIIAVRHLSINICQGVCGEKNDRQCLFLHTSRNDYYHSKWEPNKIKSRRNGKKNYLRRSVFHFYSESESLPRYPLLILFVCFRSHRI